MMKRIYFEVHGTVQGVGFRYFTRKKALGYRITGWCRNTVNNTVEGEAQGDDEAIQQFLNDVDKGPHLAKVTKVAKEDREVVQGELAFQVRR